MAKSLRSEPERQTLSLTMRANAIRRIARAFVAAIALRLLTAEADLTESG